MQQLALNGQVNIVKNAADAAGVLKGTIVNVVYAASSNDTTLATNKDAGSATQIEMVDDIHVGSYIDIYCDGTNWQASGVIIADARNAVTFDA